MAKFEKYAVKSSSKGYKWMYRVDIGINPANGKRMQKCKRGFDTKKDAETHCANFLNNRTQTPNVKPQKLTINELVNKWLLSKNKIRDTTMKKYERNINNHIKPALGYLEVSKLSDEHLNLFYKQLKQENNLSSTTINDIHKLTKQLLNYAIKKKYITENAASIVETPQQHRKQIQVWDNKDCNIFLESVKEHREYIAFLLALTTGMRQSEILALTWENVNLEKRSLYVKQTLERGTRKIIPKVKSKNSQRSISLDQKTINELSKQRKKLLKEKLFLGEEYEDYDLVIPTSKGTPINHRNLLRTFYRYMKKADVRQIDFHDLRHTHASMLLQNGANPKAVAERLGHDVRTLMETYAHVMPNIQEEIANNFGSTFFSDQPQKTNLKNM